MSLQTLLEAAEFLECKADNTTEQLPCTGRSPETSQTVVKSPVAWIKKSLPAPTQSNEESEKSEINTQDNGFVTGGLSSQSNVVVQNAGVKMTTFSLGQTHEMTNKRQDCDTQLNAVMKPPIPHTNKSSSDQIVRDESSHPVLVHPLQVQLGTAADSVSLGKETRKHSSKLYAVRNSDGSFSRHVVDTGMTQSPTVKSKECMLMMDSQKHPCQNTFQLPHTSEWCDILPDKVSFLNTYAGYGQIPHKVMTPKGATKPHQPALDINMLLPSLVKASETEKGLNDNQFKQVKRAVTLTHNQLEKNRRAHLKECFEALKASIPRLGMRRSSNLTILKAALRHIQILNRKSIEYKSTLDQLKKDNASKTKRLALVTNDLLEVADNKKIEQYLQETLKNDFSLVQSGSNISYNSVLDHDQQSTSTASEAEEEEFRSSSMVLAGDAPKLFPHPSAITVNLSDLSNNKEQTPRRSYLPSQLLQRQEHNLIQQSQINTVHLKETVSTQSKTWQQAEEAKAIKRNVHHSTPKRSPVKLFGQPSGRSATPSPPSNFISFFPRFSIGSGGSPPLHTSSMFDPAETKSNSSLNLEGASGLPTEQSVNISVTQTKSPTLTNTLGHQPAHLSLPYPSITYNTLQNQKAGFVPQATNELKPSVELTSSKLSDSHSFLKEVDNNASTLIDNTERNTTLSAFSNYQVKVKYLSSTPSSFDQTHIPMKKRYHDSKAFSTCNALHTLNKVTATPRSDSELKMTSLYVGASADLLGSTSRKSDITSTSDNESDRDSPMFMERNLGKMHQQWKKNITNDRSAKDWLEYKNKSIEKSGKKKTFLLHHYEAPSSRNVMNSLQKVSNDVKPKATFSLWDRKHHAITMTTATNWRGKHQQQLLASKCKISAGSAIASSQGASLSTQGSLTQVCYTTLQKASKPAVPSSLVLEKSNILTAISDATATAACAKPVVAHTPNSESVRPSSNIGTSATQSNNCSSHVTQQNVLQCHPVSVTVGGDNQLAYQFIPGLQVLSAASEKTTNHQMSKVNQPIISSLPKSLSYVTVSSAEFSRSSVGDKNPDSNLTVIPRETVLTPAVTPTNAAQIPQVPYVIPFGYVMYPANMANAVNPTGLHITGLQGQENVTDALPLEPLHIQQGIPALANITAKYPSPSVLPSKKRNRQSSQESNGSSVNIEAVNLENEELGHVISKKRRLTDQKQLFEENSNNQTDAAPSLSVSTAKQTIPQAHLVLPHNPGFVLAAPSPANGYTIPVNLVSYNFQTSFHTSRTGACMQAIQLAGLPNTQPLQTIGQVWPVNESFVHPIHLSVTSNGITQGAFTDGTSSTSSIPPR